MKQRLPRPGHDYTNAKAAKADYLSGHEFILADVSSHWHEKLCSCRDFHGEAGQRRITIVTAPAKEN